MLRLVEKKRNSEIEISTRKAIFSEKASNIDKVTNTSEPKYYVTKDIVTFHQKFLIIATSRIQLHCRRYKKRSDIRIDTRHDTVTEKS